MADLHLSEVKRPDTDVSFSLEFHKARERSPEIRRDFQNVMIALVDDQWISSAFLGKRENPSPLGLKFLDALQKILAGQGMATKTISSETWQVECVRLGLIDPKKEERQRADAVQQI